MPAIKPILAALALTATLAGFAHAQQPGGEQPTAKPPEQRSENDRPSRSEERGDRGRGRFEDRPAMGMMPLMAGMARFCGPNSGRAAEAMLAGMERATKPTTEQQTAFNNLKVATTRAAEIISAACPAEVSVTPPGRLAAAEKGLTAMLEGVRLVRPAMDAFYASLSDEQKARLYLTQRRLGEVRGGFDRGEQRWREREGRDDRQRPERDRNRGNDDNDDDDDDGPRRL